MLCAFLRKFRKKLCQTKLFLHNETWTLLSLPLLRIEVSDPKMVNSDEEEQQEEKKVEAGLIESFQTWGIPAV